MKKILLFAMALVLTALLPTQPSAQAADEVASWDVNLNINGQTYHTTDAEGAPYINTQGRTMVPIRVISDALNFQVAFSNGEVFVENKDLGVSARFFNNQNYYESNNQQYTMDSKMVISNKGRAYIPLRALLSIHADVAWNAHTRTVYVTGNTSSGGQNLSKPNVSGKYTLINYPNSTDRVLQFKPSDGSSVKYYKFSSEDAAFLTDSSVIDNVETGQKTKKPNNAVYIGIWSGNIQDFSLSYYKIPQDGSDTLAYIGIVAKSSDFILGDKFIYSTAGPFAIDLISGGKNIIYKASIGIRGASEIIKTEVPVYKSRFAINNDELWVYSPDGKKTKILDKV